MRTAGEAPGTVHAVAAGDALGNAGGRTGAGHQRVLGNKQFLCALRGQPRGEQSAAAADHHGPAERTIDDRRRFVDPQCVRERQLQATVGAWNPQSKESVLQQRTADRLR